MIIEIGEYAQHYLLKRLSNTMSHNAQCSYMYSTETHQYTGDGLFICKLHVILKGQIFLCVHGLGFRV
jgi:hypothetical protein